MKYKSVIFVIAVLFFCQSCAKEAGIFPLVSTSTSESELVFPNPISLAIDEANSQIVVVNSNVDILYDTGSVAVLSVDASDANAPVLAAQKVISIPNFAGENYFDGVSSIYIPFRNTSETNSSLDTLKKYSLSASDIEEAATGTVAPDPYGIAGDASQIYVVSNDILGIYDTSLDKVAEVDLTLADTAGIDDSLAGDVLSVAVDTTTNLAIVSNAGGRMFIVDLATNAIRQVVDGPTSSRNLIIDGNGLLYVLDAISEAVWIFDLNNLPAVTSAPESTDDSKFIIASVTVGRGPFGMTLDQVNQKLYVGNFDEDSISVIDTLTYQEIDRISLDKDHLSSSYLRACDGPFSLHTGTFSGNQYLFVACFLSHDVLMINTDSLQVVELYPNTEI